MPNVVAKMVDRFELMTDPGCFMWTGRESPHAPPTMMFFVCPCGCKSVCGVAVGGDPSKHPVWGWNGDLEKPTATPSIRVLDGCQ